MNSREYLTQVMARALYQLAYEMQACQDTECQHILTDAVVQSGGVVAFSTGSAEALLVRLASALIEESDRVTTQMVEAASAPLTAGQERILRSHFQETGAYPVPSAAYSATRNPDGTVTVRTSGGTGGQS